MTMPQYASIEKDGWTLESGEARHARSPETFHIPSRADRESLRPGDGVQLLFDIESKEGDRLIDRGVDRLWVIVKTRTGGVYVGVLDSDPGVSPHLTLRPGSEVLFGPEHVIAINRPPDAYLKQRFGPAFFDE